jgi:serine/threonine protein kinase
MFKPDDDKPRTYVTLTNGTMVMHYRIIEKIGASGMGEVYLAEDTELNLNAKYLSLLQGNMSR